MHRSIEASVPAERTDAIVHALEAHPCVVGLNVMRGSSIKPRGDTILLHVLNRGADDVMRIISDRASKESYSIVTSEVASISDPAFQHAIDHDIDEAIWEEMETGLRHNGRLTTNYVLLMVLGGVIAAVGFVSPVHEQVIAFVAASIIAPGLEPLAKIPLGIVLKRPQVLWVGLKASVVGYAVLIVAAGLTFFLLERAGAVERVTFLGHEATTSLLETKAKDVVLSAAAAAAAIAMYLAYRRNVIAGPLVALIMIPAAAAVGMSIAIGEWTYAGPIAQRLGIDVALVVAAGLVLIYVKQAFVHKRAPVR